MSPSPAPTDPAELPRLTPMGLDGMLVTFADRMDEAANRAALAFRADLEAAEWPGLRETATSLCSAYVSFDPERLPPPELARRLRDLLDTRDWGAANLPPARTLWTIPACFEGDHAPQLAEAARQAGVGTETAVREICARPLRAFALGYAPGQAYLGQLPPHWDLPRQSDLTPTVHTGAVVTAVRQIIVFATTGPTGWQQVAMTRFEAFRPQDSHRPIPLSPGDEVQLRPVSASEFDALGDDPMGGATERALS